MLILRQREFVKKKKQNRKLLRAAENEVMHVNRAAKKALKAQKALERGNINEAEQLTKSAEKAVQSARMDGGRLEQMATKISKTRPSALSDEGLRISEVGAKEAEVFVSPRSKKVYVDATFGRNPTTGLEHNYNNSIGVTNLKSNNRQIMTIIPRSTAYSPNIRVYESNAGTEKRLLSSGNTRDAINNSRAAAVQSPNPVVPERALVVSNSKPVIKTESKLSRLAKNKYVQAGAGLLALGGIGYGVHRHIKNKNKGE